MSFMTKRIQSSKIMTFSALLLLALSIGIVPTVWADLGFGESAAINFGDADELVTARSVFSRTLAEAGNSYAAAVVVDISDGWHVNSANPYQDWLIAGELTFDTIPGLTPGALIYPPSEDFTMLDEQVSVWGGQVILSFEIAVGDDAAEGEHVLPIAFTYQPCNDQVCVAPETVELPLTITVGSGGKAINGTIFAAVSKTDDAGPADATGDQSSGSDNEIQRLIDEHGVWGYFIALGLAFVTGLILSFSPCTYPMIPITVSIFAGQDRSIGRGFVMSLFYVGSMAFVYGVMGMIVSMVGGVFGAWLASPAVVIGIAVVFVVFSLSMFGLYELQVPLFLRQKLGGTKGGGGIGGAIVLGLVAALVVSPCVGPFVAGILLYVATSGSALIGFMVLFVFALGLGTLFVIVGSFSNAINKLPGSGGWMEQVKKFFGFILLIMALYFLRTIIPADTLALLTGLLLLSFGIFGGGFDRLMPEDGFFPRLKKFLGVLATIIAVYLLAGSLVKDGMIFAPASEWLPSGTGTVQSETKLIDWGTDLSSGLEMALAQKKPVLIDTWATWCINCKVLEKKTFGDPNVAAEAGRFVALKIQLESQNTPETKEFMARFNMKLYSLPTTLLIDSKGEVQEMITGVIDPEEMIAKMQNVR
jgi:thiol:disulfide interchange protein DsbD